MMVLSALQRRRRTRDRSAYSYFYGRRSVGCLAVAGVLARRGRAREPALAYPALLCSAGSAGSRCWSPGVGITVNGNRNWLYLGAAVHDPARRVRQAGHRAVGRRHPGAQATLARPARHLLIPLLPVTGLLILLVLFQRDPGTAVAMAAIVAGMLWIVGAPMRVLRRCRCRHRRGGRDLRLLAGPVAAAGGLPGSDRRPGGANDQANAGMFAIASGGWWGVGLGASRQKWGSLPEAHTDFIFAVLGEEFGLFGSLVVLLLYRRRSATPGSGSPPAATTRSPGYAAGGVTIWFVARR